MRWIITLWVVCVVMHKMSFYEKWIWIFIISCFEYFWVVISYFNYKHVWYLLYKWHWVQISAFVCEKVIFRSISQKSNFWIVFGAPTQLYVILTAIGAPAQPSQQGWLLTSVDFLFTLHLKPTFNNFSRRIRFRSLFYEMMFS
jgi:hypothetical protein